MQNKKEKILTKIMEPVMGQIKLGVFLGAAGALSYVLSSFAFAFVISELAAGRAHYWALIAAGALIFGEFFLRMTGFGVSHKAAFELEQILRTKLSAHLALIPFGEILTNGTGKLKKVMLDDVKNLHSFVADTTPTIGRLIVAPLGSAIALGYFDYRLLLISLACVLVLGVILSLAFKDGDKYREEYDQNQAKINSSIIEFVQAMPVVRTFSDGKSSFKRYDAALNSYTQSLKNWLAVASLPSRIGHVLFSPVPTFTIVGLSGAYFYLNGSLDLGDFAGALITATGLIDAMMPFMILDNFIKKSQIAAKGILSVLDIKPLPVAADPKTPQDASVEFKNVSFAYSTRKTLALDNVSFKVASGSVTALVGKSGAGKSTVAALIPRFWDAQSGQILVGGVNVKDTDPKVLMEHVSFVFQDTFLFNESIYENIAKSKPGATKEDVIKAARAAQIHDFIESLPQGYDTIAGERGANLSGGQKQRITIARTILRDTPIIVLDEATAFADPENEEEIIKAISNLIIGKTTIIIAHRLSTIKEADEILVFDAGKIVQRGKHDELIKEGEYKKLWESYQSAQDWDIRSKNAN
ncbi:MAG: ABC transporter ATP-binding protein [Helicobacteraceae bacterium]